MNGGIRDCGWAARSIPCCRARAVLHLRDRSGRALSLLPTPAGTCKGTSHDPGSRYRVRGGEKAAHSAGAELLGVY